MACGKAGAFKGAAGQQEARRVARALVRYGGGGEGGGEAAPLGPEWAESLEGLCPLPEGVASHLPGGAAVGWDMQAVENVLCGIHGKKTPAAIVASAANEASRERRTRARTASTMTCTAAWADCAREKYR